MCFSNDFGKNGLPQACSEQLHAAHLWQAIVILEALLVRCDGAAALWLVLPSALVVASVSLSGGSLPPLCRLEPTCMHSACPFKKKSKVYTVRLHNGSICPQKQPISCFMHLVMRLVMYSCRLCIDLSAHSCLLAQSFSPSGPFSWTPWRVSNQKS